MTEEENPYAPPISSNDDCTFDGDITTQSLRYLNRASKFAMFAIIVCLVYVVSSLVVTLLFETRLAKILSTFFHMLVTIFIVWYAWKYTQCSKKIQKNQNTNNLLECFYYSTKVQKIFGIYSILLLSIVAIAYAVILFLLSSLFSGSIK
ncbi:MAG: hypothetical protein IJ187_11105 [Neisseriaceae bacterium]|nr:hypothetical protein [Neisseriaceae bacterium]